MKCPFCGSNLSKVVDKRGVGTRSEIRRRRECLKCSKRFTTYEALAKLEVFVVKKDGRREGFLREKLEVGIVKALEKRPGLEQAGAIVDRIESKMRVKGMKEISSQMLGRWVLGELKKMDRVAYLRFASVYRTFSDVKDFEKELESIS
ncbi:transcriptional repressor NrdR [Candidatus Daviesbacteria bacterium]|nr:transcriptional repressor NrdR [Candidatus Daviesbacteria bacterium]